MEGTDSSSRKTQQLIAYFVLAYVLSWAIGIPLALANHAVIPAVLPQWTHYLIPFGPMLSALTVTLVSEGIPGLKEIGRRMIRWACPKWWLVALSPLFFGWILLLLINWITGSQITLPSLGTVKFLPPLGMNALLLLIFTYGLGEETGWRGFALPRLQNGRTDFSATIILAAFWALWHLPQFFYAFELSYMSVGWLVGLFFGAMFLTWLFNSSDSILIAAVWHGCYNFITATTTETGILPVLLSAIVIFWVIMLLRKFGPKNLISL